MATHEPVTITKMALKKIKLGRNSRLDIKSDELDGLMESIKEVGLLQPIGVVKVANGYEVAYGNRRFLACSKLGMHNMPVIVHQDKVAKEIDIKNLAENVQRRNLSPIEIGRYVDLLQKENMKIGEIGVRLGTTRTFVATCLDAFNNVPKEYRDDLVVSTNGRPVPGKITLNIARSINTAERRYRLNKTQKGKLYKAAKWSEKFNSELIPRYASALMKGQDDFVENVPNLRVITLRIMITEKQYDELQKKYVDAGPFNSITALLEAILKGEKAVPIKIFKGNDV